MRLDHDRAVTRVAATSMWLLRFGAISSPLAESEARGYIAPKYYTSHRDDWAYPAGKSSPCAKRASRESTEHRWAVSRNAWGTRRQPRICDVLSYRKRPQTSKPHERDRHGGNASFPFRP
jgi:hypothetical protein